jgi:putative transposase
VICQFIDAHRDRFGVVPICRALSQHGVPIAPRTYWSRRSRPPSRRALRDGALTEILAGFYEPGERGRRRPESLYGSLKMHAHLRRQGIEVARCTVERLMRANGWRGVTRARRTRTTVPDLAHTRAPDLVNRNFTAERPGRLHVADFTYVPMDGGGFGYTAFCIDAFAGLIAGWDCSSSKQTAFVERAIRQAAALRARQGHPIGGNAIHHSDAGSQYTSVRFAETLALAGLAGSVGSAGDAYDNALAETTIGLYKTECTREGSPFRNGPITTLADLEEATSAWVHWYNNHRLMHRLGRKPPAEAEADHYARAEAITDPGRAA